MELYVLGVIIAFIVNILRGVFALSNLISVKSRNFRKLKLYYDFTSGGYVKTKTSITKYILIFGELLIISPLFSWLSIGWFSFNLIRGFIKKGQVPEKIKEINFKLSSADLSKEKIKECLDQLAEFYGYPKVDFRTISDEEEYDSDELVIEFADEETHWGVDVYLNKEQNQYTLTARSPDYSSKHTHVDEYKFENSKIYSRSIDHKFEYYVDEEYDLKDGVVLEDEIRKKNAESSFPQSEERIQEKIAELHESTKWSEPRRRIQYFILFRHDDFLNDSELRHFFRAEVNRIQKGCSNLKDEVESLGGYIVAPDFDEFASFSRIRTKEETSEENQKMISALSKDPSKFNITYEEFNESEKLLEELRLYISRLG